MPADNQLTMPTCGPIVFPMLWRIQYLQIIFDFNALDIKSMPMVINWYKIEIANHIHKQSFSYLLPEGKCE